MTSTLALWILLLAVIAATGWRARRYAVSLASAPGARRFDQPLRRLEGVAVAVGLHRKMLRKPLAGILHVIIFISFFVLFTATIEAFGARLFPGVTILPGLDRTWIALLQDVFSVLMLAGVGLALYQRYVLKPARFKGSSRADAVI